MSLLAYTPSVLAALLADLKAGRAGPVTVQFFQQLFTRVGGAEAPTNNELGGTGVVLDIAGIPNRITIGGTAAHPTVDIAPTYQGQTSLTTLGTITVGNWQGTAIAPTHGGTGVSTAFTAGAIVFVGAAGVYAQNSADLSWDDANTQLKVVAGSASAIPLVVKGAVAQSGAHVEVRDTGNTTLYRIDSKGNVSQAIGATTALMTGIGVANVQTSATGVGNAADTTDDTLFTYTLPSNSLAANGKSLRVVATGHFASNGNNKRVKVWFAGTAVADSGVVTLNNVDWVCTIEVTRLDATHVSCVGTFTANGVASVVKVTANLVVSDLGSNSSIIKSTGASTTTGAASDVLGYLLKTWFEN